MKFSLRRLMVFTAIIAIIAAVYGAVYRNFDSFTVGDTSWSEQVAMSGVLTLLVCLGGFLLCTGVFGLWMLADSIERLLRRKD